MASCFESVVAQVISVLQMDPELEPLLYRDLTEPLGLEVDRALILQLGKSEWREHGQGHSLQKRVEVQFNVVAISRTGNWYQDIDELLVKANKAVFDAFKDSKYHLTPTETVHETKSADLPVAAVTQSYTVTIVTSARNFEKVY